MRIALVWVTAVFVALAVQAADTVTDLRTEAENGNLDALYQLAVAYRDGKGVPQDYAEAYAWLEVAACVEDAGHARELDELAKRMTAEQVAAAQARSEEYFARYVEPLLRDGD